MCIVLEILRSVHRESEHTLPPPHHKVHPPTHLCPEKTVAWQVDSFYTQPGGITAVTTDNAK